MIYKYKDIIKLKDSLRGKKVVFATGCFDIVHRGHLEHLYSAAKHGDVLVVGVLPDKYIRVFKQREPVNTQLERASLIEALKPVSHVILTSFTNDKRASTKILKKLQPDIFFYQGKNIYKLLEPELQKIGVTIQESHLQKMNSTTKIIKKTKEL